jgi:hypothetical protein|tara:strand:+ start:1726 stop:1989 length:264 start_codon:yes stop_codon:yes gene_type:complete
MTEEGKNAVAEFTAIKENENKINRNLIELNNYFKHSGKTEEMNEILEKEMKFQEKIKASHYLYKLSGYNRKYLSNPNRVNPKRKLNK